MSQQKYVTKVLERFNMSKEKSVGSILVTNYRLNAKNAQKRTRTRLR